MKTQKTFNCFRTGKRLAGICFAAGLFSLFPCSVLAQETIDIGTLGIRYSLTDEMKESGLDVHVTEFTPASSYGEFDIYSSGQLFCGIVVMKDADAKLTDGRSISEVYQEQYPDYEVTEYENGDYCYIQIDCGKALDLDALSDEEQERALKCLELYPKLLETIEYIEVEEMDLGKLTFDSLNLDGEAITDEIFSEKDLTVVNVWATYCNPCIEEMPELAAWEKELPENVQILYVCSDLFSIEDDTHMDMAKMITGKAGIDPKHVVLSLPGTFPQMASLITAVPTTLFVDEEGHIYDDIIVGAYVEKYKETVERLTASEE